jgi:hypothetical protein
MRILSHRRGNPETDVGRSLRPPRHAPTLLGRCCGRAFRGYRFAEPPATLLDPFGDDVPGPGGSRAGNAGFGGGKGRRGVRLDNRPPNIDRTAGRFRTAGITRPNAIHGVPKPTPSFKTNDPRNTFIRRRIGPPGIQTGPPKTRHTTSPRRTPSGRKRAALKGHKRVAGGWSEAPTPGTPPPPHRPNPDRGSRRPG